MELDMYLDRKHISKIKMLGLMYQHINKMLNNVLTVFVFVSQNFLNTNCFKSFYSASKNYNEKKN